MAGSGVAKVRARSSSCADLMTVCASKELGQLELAAAAGTPHVDLQGTGNAGFTTDSIVDG